LNDTLKISPDEQVGLMKRLYHDQLPFSTRAQRIVKGMMLQESAQDYKLYYKTGWGNDTKSGKDLMWVVGYAETIHRLKNPKTKEIEAIPHPYFFALCFKAEPGTPNLVEKRIQILHDLLTRSSIHKY
jgi:beta-lactamase class D